MTSSVYNIVAYTQDFSKHRASCNLSSSFNISKDVHKCLWPRSTVDNLRALNDKLWN